MLEQYESSVKHERWRDWIRNFLQDVAPDEPRYIDAFLAARWFSQAFAERLLCLSDVKGNQGKPFVEVLLDTIADANRSTTQEAATRFEAAAGLLLSSTPGFEVLSSRKTSDQQTDLVVHYAPDRLTRLKLAVGPGLVECKSSAKPVGVDELRDFGAKCLFHRVSFGILVAHTGITGQGKHVFAKPEYAELVRRRFQVDGLTLLVLDISQLRGKSRELRGLQDELAADHEYLVFGPKSGELDSSDPPKSSP